MSSFPTSNEAGKPEASPEYSGVPQLRLFAPTWFRRHAPCEWCTGPIPETARRDAITCSQECRQALHRFRLDVGPPAADRAMRFAYADPPYPGLAWKYYRSDEVDHAELVRRLVADFPDGWALSTSAEALQFVLGLCPKGVRTCPWFRGPRKVKARRALNAWEPLLVFGGREREAAVVEDLTDSLVLSASARPRSHPGALVGMKAPAFAEWMFRLLGARRGDELVDLFPGSGAVTRAWKLFTREKSRSALPSRLTGAQRRIGGRA